MSAPSTHGQSKTALYAVYKAMKRRCSDKKYKSYHRYGGRGIRVCEEWLDSFKAFWIFALVNGYKEPEKGTVNNKTTMDRINNDGNYEPNNVRFVSMSENNKNKRLTEAGIEARRKNSVLGVQKTSKAVMCLEIMQLFPSINSASRYLDIPHSCIRQALRSGNATKGFHFERFLKKDGKWKEKG